jgi:dipeptidase E
VASDRRWKATAVSPPFNRQNNPLADHRQLEGQVSVASSMLRLDDWEHREASTHFQRHRECKHSRRACRLAGQADRHLKRVVRPYGYLPLPRRWREGEGGDLRRAKSPLCELGWKSLGVLELTALPSIQRESWVPTLQETDALLVWGGNVLFLCYWMQRSGLAELLPSLENLVYVGVSGGSIAMTPHNCDPEWNRRFVPPGSDMAPASERALGLIDFALCVHLDNPDRIFESNSMANIERWAAGVPVSTYAIDDESAIKVSGGRVEVISEGHWRLLTPSTRSA